MAAPEKRNFDLYDIWNSARRYLRIVIGLPLACILVVAVLLIARAPKATLHMAISVGLLEGKLIEEPKEITSLLNAVHGMSFNTVANPGLTRVATDSYLLNITGSASDPAAGVGLLRSVGARIVERHKEIFDKRRELLADRRKMLQQQVAMLRPIAQEALRESAPQVAGMAMLNAVGRRTTVEQLIEAERMLADLEARMAEPANRPTIIVRQPEAFTAGLMDFLIPLLAAGLGGLLLGVTCAVALEIVDRLRRGANHRLSGDVGGATGSPR